MDVLGSANGTARLPFIIITILRFKEGKFVTNRGVFFTLYSMWCVVYYVNALSVCSVAGNAGIIMTCSIQRKIYYATEGGWVHGRICTQAMNEARAPHARTYAPF